MKATELLEKQHRKVETLFKSLETSRSSPGKVVEELATSLTAHSAIEEELFYPEAVRANKERVLESYEEHDILAFALKRLAAYNPEGDKLTAKVKIVKDIFEAHVAEEERDLFPAVAQVLGDEENEALGKQLEARFKELEAEGYEGASGARKAKRAQNGGRTKTGKKKVSHAARKAA